MTSIADHIRRIKEHFQQLNDAIDYGIESRPVTIGIHTSICSVELLEIYLHKKKLISTGKTLKHTWFERPKPEQKIPPLIERKLPVNFEDKEKVYGLIYNIEEVRDVLIYGRSSVNQIKQAVENFQKLREIMLKKLSEEGIKIE